MVLWAIVSSWKRTILFMAVDIINDLIVVRDTSGIYTNKTEIHMLVAIQIGKFTNEFQSTVFYEYRKINYRRGPREQVDFKLSCQGYT